MHSDVIDNGHENALPTIQVGELSEGERERLRQLAHVVIELFLASQSDEQGQRRDWVN